MDATTRTAKVVVVLQKHTRPLRNSKWFIITFLSLISFGPLQSNALMSPRDDQTRSLTQSWKVVSSPTQRLHRERSPRMQTLSSSDHLVTESLPLLEKPLPTRQYAGHIHLPPRNANDDDDNADKEKKEKERNLFYWLFAPGNDTASNKKDNLDSTNSGKRPPLVIWINGGPGYSSLSGLFLENGPFSFRQSKSTGNWTIQLNKYSWHQAPAWMLYVDSPVGTGLSYVSNDEHDEELCRDYPCIASDFYDFLLELLWLHRDDMLEQSPTFESDGHYVMKRELFIAGESMGGSFVPVIADYVMKENEHLREGGQLQNDGNDKVQLPPIIASVTGIAIGNGYMDPKTQSDNIEALFGRGMISRSQLVSLDQKLSTCVKRLDDPNATDDDMDCLWDIDYEATPASAGKFCPYDARIWQGGKGHAEYPLGTSAVEAYFGKGGTQEKLGITDEDVQNVLRAIHASEFSQETVNGKKQRFRMGAIDRVGRALYNDYYDLVGVEKEVVSLLMDHGSRVLFYNGVDDLMCDHIGNEKFLDRLSWNRRMEWEQVERYVWLPSLKRGGGKPGGFAKELDNLSFLKLLDAGHLVPMDQPEISLEMMKLFLRGEKFDGAKQNMDQADPEMTNDCATLSAARDEVQPTKTSEESITASPNQYAADVAYSSPELAASPAPLQAPAHHVEESNTASPSESYADAKVSIWLCVLISCLSTILAFVAGRSGIGQRSITISYDKITDVYEKEGTQIDKDII